MRFLATDEISIHSPRMGRDSPTRPGPSREKISIHSPRMGRDRTGRVGFYRLGDFNPLSPHGERLLSSASAQTGVSNFNPLSPHGERRKLAGLLPDLGDFNPLSPHGERRREEAGSVRQSSFQSTLPAWGETDERAKICKEIAISIHSPRMGRDGALRGPILWAENFNPLSPHGERPRLPSLQRMMRTFQSTLPAWGETAYHLLRINYTTISIHSPRMGRDSKRTQLFEEKNWRICTTLYLFASKGVLPADKKTF